ncbi:single-stranded DNA-binding protein [Paraconexibacter antarcticus]|uniref:Single-stranded DNA-binding protein n=1 Tax=Paraconexibacter antarcticus TaxID=2949664 RepID=A0ABY5DW55_9ACTN|nr:single-stranded DNA-binding protein [Paraconexibacter antarcticus]UTI64875.1 single-stranded DNA-binding protein [Paraconexibacter antarcticus]
MNNTNTIALKHTRSSTRGRPPRGSGRCTGSSGAATSQSSSRTFHIDAATSHLHSQGYVSLATFATPPPSPPRRGIETASKDPKFLETENGTSICTLRIAVKRAGKQGHDGYFDVKCFDAQASACAQYLKAGREIALDGRLLFDEFQTQDGSYASRVYIVAERVEFLASRNRTNAQASPEPSPEQPAANGDEAREANPAA